MKIQLGKRYKNFTRNQIVEVIAIVGNSVNYKVIQGNETNQIKEFFCTPDRFKNLYFEAR